MIFINQHWHFQVANSNDFVSRGPVSVKPDILFMDEPASALDPIATAQLEETMLELKKDYTIVIVTHSMQQAARASDYTGFFYLGNLIEYDKTFEYFQNAKLQSTNDYVSGHFG